MLHDNKDRMIQMLAPVYGTGIYNILAPVYGTGIYL